MPVDQPSGTEPLPDAAGPVFVTGAGGFLGRHIVSAFVQAGRRVVGFGRREAAAEPGLGVSAPSAYVAGNLSREDLARAAGEHGSPAVLIHAAGGSSVGASIADPEGDLARNVGSLQESLAFLAEHAPRARLVYLSSAAIYGAGATGPIAETARLDPVSPYGRHKQIAEALIGEAAAAWGADAVTVRFFSAYGPGLRKQILWELAGRLLARPAEVVLSGTGEEARDFLYVDDAVDAFLRAGAADACNGQVFNVGGTAPVSLRELVALLIELAGSGSVRLVDWPHEKKTIDIGSFYADSSRIAAAVGWAPQVPLRDGLERTLAFYREHFARYARADEGRAATS